VPPAASWAGRARAVVSPAALIRRGRMLRKNPAALLFPGLCTHRRALVSNAERGGRTASLRLKFCKIETLLNSLEKIGGRLVSLFA